MIKMVNLLNNEKHDSMTETENLIIDLCNQCYELIARDDYVTNKKVFNKYSQIYDAAYDLIKSEPHSMQNIQNMLDPVIFNIFYMTMKKSGM